jgi:phosphoribosyl 1,2-cyclic phosphodiesterase
MRLRFLGTGASGGTPGEGRSRRRESSLALDERLLIDVTRDFAAQVRGLRQIDAVLLTHGHRDAIGGMARLRRWWLERAPLPPIDVYMSAATHGVLTARFARLEHCRPVLVAPGGRLRAGPWRVSAIAVPHARQARFATFAWRLEQGRTSFVYASDVARLTRELERFSRGASLLVLDGAMWRRRLFSHLTIDEALPQVCRWQVQAVALTQIGRSAPPHERLEREVAALCPRARPAYDGLVVEL